MSGNTTQKHVYLWWSVDGTTMVPVSIANPLPVTGGASSNASVGVTGTTAPTSATELGYIDGSGNLTGVSTANPLPITGSISATNPSVAAIAGAVPVQATYLGASVSGTLTGLIATANGLKVDGSAVTQPVSGTISAAQSGTWNVNNVSGTVSLPTLAATSTLQTTGNTSLSTIVTNTANSGTPTLQSGSTTAVTQPTAANLNATVVGTGTFATQLTGATNNINNVSGTVSLPTGAATSNNQTSIQSSPGTPQTTAVTIQGNASSVAVPISGTFWQGTQPVSLISLPLPLNAAQETGNLATLVLNTNPISDPQGIDTDSILISLTSTVNMLKILSFQLRELPINIANALNQTLNQGNGIIRYTNIDSLETYQFDGLSQLNEIH